MELLNRRKLSSLHIGGVKKKQSINIIKILMIETK
jgi:hypothetical protein